MVLWMTAVFALSVTASCGHATIWIDSITIGGDTRATVITLLTNRLGTTINQSNEDQDSSCGRGPEPRHQLGVTSMLLMYQGV